MRGSYGVLFLALAACAGENAGGVGPVAAEVHPPVAALAPWEHSWLEELGATDPRLGQRLRDKPSATAIERAAAAAAVRGDTSLGVVDGGIDLFSFNARVQRLGALRLDLAHMPDDGSASARAEKTLLTRLLDAEDLRVELERQAPDSASERVRAMVAVWGRPSSPREVSARESMVERGLVDVLPAVQEGELSGARALELEDALDALERLAVPEGYPRATQAITALRVELGKRHPKPPLVPAAPVPPTLQAILGAYLGVHDAPDALSAHLDDEEASLRVEAKEKLKQMPEHTVTETLALADKRVEAPSPCVPIERPSIVRSLAPPPERATVCGVLDLAARSEDGLGAAALAAVTLHDDVAIAIWALALAQGATDLDVTRTAHPLLASVPSPRQDRLVRLALVSPASAVAAGMAATLLDADGATARRGRAVQWEAFGDAPFDVVEGELAAKK